MIADDDRVDARVKAIAPGDGQDLHLPCPGRPYIRSGDPGDLIAVRATSSLLHIQPITSPAPLPPPTRARGPASDWP